jgi:hypothetical protein
MLYRPSNGCSTKKTPPGGKEKDQEIITERVYAGVQRARKQGKTYSTDLWVANY